MANEEPTNSARQPAVGDVIRNTRLGSEATYRVCAVDGATVEVEVLEAPGLDRGQRLRFTSQAVRAMELMTAGSEAPSSPGTVRRPGLSQA